MDDAQWRNGNIVSASKCDLEGLPSRQLVWVRVRAIGKTKGPWSDAVSIAAQQELNLTQRAQRGGDVVRVAVVVCECVGGVGIGSGAGLSRIDFGSSIV